MSVLRDLQSSQPSSSEIAKKTRAKYRYWRTRIFYSIYIGYALFYFTRKSFAAIKPVLINDLGFDIASIAGLESLLWIAYGISKFLSGIMSDRSSLRYFMGGGLILTGVFNLLFGCSSSLLFFSIFLVLNGLFQGWGAPPCAKLLTYWYAQKERGRWWGIWNTSHNLGGALVPLICTLAMQAFGWRSAMFFPGILAIIVGIFLINRLRDTPQSLGLPPVEVYCNDTFERRVPVEQTNDKKLKAKTLLMEYILKNKVIWILSISFFFVYIVRTALNDWIHIYLIQEKQYTKMLAAFSISCFEVGGFFGSLAAGYLSDTLFKGRRIPINVVFITGLIFVLLMIWLVPLNHPLFTSSTMFLFGFLIFGPQMLIGMAAAELVDKKAAGTATGFAGFFAYLGAACAGFPVGIIQKAYGWGGFFFLISACSLIAVTLLVPLWSKGKGVQPSLEPT